MKNFVSDKEFVATLSTKRPLIVTTDYTRPDTTTPYVSKSIINKLTSKGKIKAVRVRGPYRYEVLAVA